MRPRRPSQHQRCRQDDETEDTRAFTFHLRKDVLFHDGTPVNADAVKFSWDRIMDPATQSKTAIGPMGSCKQAVVVDEFTIRAEFTDACAPFLDAAATVDQETRKTLLGQIQQLAMNEALVAPINNFGATYALRSYVKHFRVDSRGWHPWLYDVWLDKQQAERQC